MKKGRLVTLYAFWDLEDGSEWVKIGEYRDEHVARFVALQHALKYRFCTRCRLGRRGAEFDPRA